MAYACTHANISGDSSAHYDTLEDVYVLGEYENPEWSMMKSASGKMLILSPDY